VTGLALTTRWLARSLEWRTETGSTSAEVMAAARAGAPHGHTVIADSQTAGRGRLGRVWHSPPGANLYLSCLYRPDAALALDRVPQITLAAGVAVCDTVNAFAAGASLKWPNDVLVADMKIAGILTEMSTQGSRAQAVVIGIGLNVGSRDFPGELARTATSLFRLTGRAPDRAEVAAHLLAGLEAWLEVFADDPAAIPAAWRRRTEIMGREVHVQKGERRITGTAARLDDAGALWLDTSDGPLRVVAGEIEVSPCP
jgi:BirA family biotin operon repressor/biotin-[acetyl-CoA-carboxylase] ligase